MINRTITIQALSPTKHNKKNILTWTAILLVYFIALVYGTNTRAFQTSSTVMTELTQAYPNQKSMDIQNNIFNDGKVSIQIENTGQELEELLTFILNKESSGIIVDILIIKINDKTIDKAMLDRIFDTFRGISVTITALTEISGQDTKISSQGTAEERKQIRFDQINVSKLDASVIQTLIGHYSVVGKKRCSKQRSTNTRQSRISRLLSSIVSSRTSAPMASTLGLRVSQWGNANLDILNIIDPSTTHVELNIDDSVSDFTSAFIDANRKLSKLVVTKLNTSQNAQDSSSFIQLLKAVTDEYIFSSISTDTDLSKLSKPAKSNSVSRLEIELIVDTNTSASEAATRVTSFLNSWMVGYNIKAQDVWCKVMGTDKKYISESITNIGQALNSSNNPSPANITNMHWQL
ncbi:hypothetical protein NEOKW01_1894 [Nematocida sp. AWRm80]|nr:hypothetical protein NEOKW01_1320 [Nematocida sp. AWRm80]KAI5181426.1 hypothetical protein NEOKW01_1607 [Nematocida sp. AWRm80]KAI5181730.1 hypothetical protein NEOKW01_1894 [Nematocida sp. AWRm80]